MSEKLEIPQIMENATNDIFGMCSICNKAKWTHTNDEKVSCTTQIMANDLKNELLKYELIAEELSGDTLFAEVSATKKDNLDKLKENTYN